MSAKACKELIDNGGKVQAKASNLFVTTQTQAVSLQTFGVKDNDEGEKWLKKVANYQERASNVLDRLNAEAMELCASQPIKD